MLVYFYSKMSTSSLLLATILSLKPEHTEALVCALFGIGGGSITQLLTIDERKPTAKVVIGDLLSSSVCGFATYVFTAEGSLLTVLLAILAGSTGSVGFQVLVRKFKPTWLEGHDKDGK